MVEKDYIDRGALQEIVYTRIKALEELYGAYDAYGSGYEECAETISEMPAADVVEVVRCKDCRYSVKYNCKNDACYNFTICRRRDYYSEGVEEDDFCSYGERKEATP